MTETADSVDRERNPTAATAANPASGRTVAPVAKKVPTVRVHHGDSFTDNYEWLRDKENPEVRAHLEAEQAYTDAVTAGQEQLRQDIFNEIKNRTQETDLSVPSRKDDWWYYSRMEEGKAYGIHCRVAAATTGEPVADWTPPVVEPDAPVPGEQVLLDGNAEAEGQPFFSIGGSGGDPGRQPVRVRRGQCRR